MTIISISPKRKGDILAICAAASNGTIGIFNRYGFISNATYINIAFFKCLGAFLILSCLLLTNRKVRLDAISRKSDWFKLSILSLFGIFTLYFFETWAFSKAPIPVISFLLYAGGIVAVMLGIIVLRESAGIAKFFSLVLVFTGVYQMLGGLQDWRAEIGGAALAIIAGVGYSIFLFLWRLFRIPSGLGTLWWFFGFGSIYLSVPFFATASSAPNVESIPSILCLILVPTIGGYYFTSKALSLTEASRVQIVETCEPLFSSLFAFIVFGDVLTIRGFIGAALIFVGLLLLVLEGRWQRLVQNCIRSTN